MAGQLGAFAGPIGLPHGHQALGIKAPQDLHREDIKVPLGPSAEERLVRIFLLEICESIKVTKMFSHLQRNNSVSPADREKYRPRSSPEMENDNKRRKEDKLTHVSFRMKFY